MMTLQEIDDFEEEFIEELESSEEDHGTKMNRLFTIRDLLSTARAAHRIQEELDDLKRNSP